MLTGRELQNLRENIEKLAVNMSQFSSEEEKMLTASNEDCRIVALMLIPVPLHQYMSHVRLDLLREFLLEDQDNWSPELVTLLEVFQIEIQD